MMTRTTLVTVAMARRKTDRLSRSSDLQRSSVASGLLSDLIARLNVEMLCRFPILSPPVNSGQGPLYIPIREEDPVACLLHTVL